MRVLPPGMQDHLDGGATTLCHCWRMTRADGVILGFTDHDRKLDFDGTQFVAFDGFEVTEMVSAVGLGVDNLDVAGALNSSRLNEDDLNAGLFDNAVVEIYTVNWRSVDQRLLIRKGNLGEVTRSGSAFTAEIRGLAHQLNQPQGRIFQYICDADLGDTRCTIDIEDPAYRGSGVVISAADRRTIRASGLTTFATDWFTRGTLVWVSGDNLDVGIEVKSYRINNGEAVIELWQSMRQDISSGDQFDVRAGCDKLFATCQGKFENALNFRGFPQMPGNDFVMSYPNRDDTRNDGSSLANQG